MQLTVARTERRSLRVCKIGVILTCASLSMNDGIMILRESWVLNGVGITRFLPTIVKSPLFSCSSLYSIDLNHGRPNYGEARSESFAQCIDAIGHAVGFFCAHAERDADVEDFLQVERKRSACGDGDAYGI